MNFPVQFGKYHLLSLLGEGGMAEVFLAKAFGVEGFEKTVVIKRIHPHFSRNASFVRMLVDEAKIAVTLNHGNIVQVYELGLVEGTHYIAMEYVHGKDLRVFLDSLAARGMLLEKDMAYFIISEILKGLDFAHRCTDAEGRPAGIVHRDVSPQNILISLEGEVKIGDFGIARAASRMEETRPGVLKGKLFYMSPEQALGQKVDHRSDLFSCGEVLFEMLTGKKVFTGESDFDVIQKVIKAEVPREDGAWRSLSEKEKKILSKALARSPEDRFQAAREFSREILSLFHGSLDVQEKLSILMKRFFGTPEKPLEEVIEVSGIPASRDSTEILVQVPGAASLEEREKSTHPGDDASAEGMTTPKAIPSTLVLSSVEKAMPTSLSTGKTRKKRLPKTAFAIPLILLALAASFWFWKEDLAPSRPSRIEGKAPPLQALSPDSSHVSPVLSQVPEKKGEKGDVSPAATGKEELLSPNSSRSASPPSSDVSTGALKVPSVKKRSVTRSPGKGFLTVNTVPWSFLEIPAAGISLEIPVYRLEIPAGTYSATLRFQDGKEIIARIVVEKNAETKVIVDAASYPPSGRTFMPGK